MATLDQHATELVLAMGLGDRLLGPDALVGGCGPTFSEADALPPDRLKAAGVGLATVQCKAETKIKQLRPDPVLRDVAAVRDKRFMVVD
ncbi:hypothetical protein [Streptomyces sp. CB03238]|uniref:hypothetical protein n=1 Tax=Streptomyces sp. CB03238 TaxID=1907777 RepID=UPI000A101F81|nr:hypothetical protein [Streptomyces sp. CB03238]ORT57103.1 hypothetical protein BKD26_26205 [Streptomyces sp. CB03238]